ncbi:hypothetical protein GCM10023184_45600 [Flaviaesturariibacter amylovorans]|uniref:Uncharacterized protein n=1 Tax=Flaviaesturariibacter amylovorans TaxID=1084520 RepID=A0ABP8HTV6_9BACT
MPTSRKYISVPKVIKPIHYNRRRTPRLVIGKGYFICFGNNKVLPCTLKEIVDKEFIIVNAPSEFGDWTNFRIYADEIGETPEEAVVNTVTM